MEQTRKFMLIFRYELPQSEPTQEEIAEMESQWCQYFGMLGEKQKLVSSEQLGFESKTISSSGEVKDDFVMTDGQALSGYVIVQASSIDEAVELGQSSPILKAGGTVEVRDIPMD